jgi:chromosome segregation ATPase
MNQPRKPAKIPTSASEARRTNVLLEAMREEIRIIAEGVADVQPRLMGVEETVGSLLQEEKLLRVFVETTKNATDANTRAIQELRRLVESHTKMLEHHTRLLVNHGQVLGELRSDGKEIKERLDSIDRRLDAAEARLPA